MPFRSPSLKKNCTKEQRLDATTDTRQVLPYALDPESCPVVLRRRDTMIKTSSPDGNAPRNGPASMPEADPRFFSRKKLAFSPTGNPVLFSVIAGTGRGRVFRTTCRSPGFCGKRKAAIVHGLNPFKIPLFKKYGNKKNIFLRCWHHFHCRISGSLPARILSVVELIREDLQSGQMTPFIKRGFTSCQRSGFPDA